MKESNLYRIFREKMKQQDPSSYWYKIPDTGKLGGKKPFDGFLVCNGKAFAIEFKVNDDPTPYQNYHLERFQIANGTPLVFNYPVMSMDKFVKKIVRLGYENRT